MNSHRPAHVLVLRPPPAAPGRQLPSPFRFTVTSNTIVAKLLNSILLLRYLLDNSILMHVRTSLPFYTSLQQPPHQNIQNPEPRFLNAVIPSIPSQIHLQVYHEQLVLLFFIRNTLPHIIIAFRASPSRSGKSRMKLLKPSRRSHDDCQKNRN